VRQRGGFTRVPHAFDRVFCESKTFCLRSRIFWLLCSQIVGYSRLDGRTDLQISVLNIADAIRSKPKPVREALAKLEEDGWLLPRTDPREVRPGAPMVWGLNPRKWSPIWGGFRPSSQGGSSRPIRWASWPPSTSGSPPPSRPPSLLEGRPQSGDQPASQEPEEQKKKKAKWMTYGEFTEEDRC